MAEFLAGVTDKYAQPLLKGRIEIEGNVISCFFKDMLLLDEVKLESKDFITSDGHFYFSLLNFTISFGVQSRISQRRSSVNTVIPLLCFRLLMVRELIPCLLINVYVVSEEKFNVFQNGL